MRYSAVFVAFMIGITAVVTAPAELAKGNTAHLAVSANEVAVTGKSYIVNEKQNYVIASEAKTKKKTSDHDNEDQSYQTYNRFKRLGSSSTSIKSHVVSPIGTCSVLGEYCKLDGPVFGQRCCSGLTCSFDYCWVIEN